MATVRDYLKSTTLPWFFKKKFLKIFGIILLVLTLIGAGLAWFIYMDQKTSGHKIRWKDVTGPLTLPLMALMIYGIIILLWIVIKLKGFQSALLRNIPSVFQAPEVNLNPGETSYAEVPMTIRYFPASMNKKMGTLRITNLRMMHTPTIAAERVGVLLGAEEPDLTFSVPFSNIRQCGFGLDEKRLQNFTVIENNGTLHSFGPVKLHHVNGAMTTLGWKRTQIGEQVYWIR